MDQRNKLEESVSNSFTAGILLRKIDPKKSQPLFTYAHEQRKKSQEVQRKMNQVKSAGTIKHARIGLDAIKLANENKKNSLPPPTAKRKREQQISDFLRGGYAIRRKFQIYRGGEPKTVIERYRPGSSSKDGARQRSFQKRKPN